MPSLCKISRQGISQDVLEYRLREYFGRDAKLVDQTHDQAGTPYQMQVPDLLSNSFISWPLEVQTRSVNVVGLVSDRALPTSIPERLE